MKAEATGDVFAFQSWLHESIRRTWILAIAVAIPGALLVTLWFPHSGWALVALALVGIGIGAVSDLVEQARKRRREEVRELTAAVRQAVHEAIMSRKETIEYIRSAVEEPNPASKYKKAAADTIALMEKNLRGLRLAPAEELIVTATESARTLRQAYAGLSAVVDPEFKESGRTFRSEGEQLWLIRTEMPEGFTPIFWLDPTSRGILLKVEEMAQRTGIPIETFLKHLSYAVSSTNILKRYQKPAEEVRQAPH